MNSWQQMKQLELYSESPRQTASGDTSSEEFIASRLSESPAGQIRLIRGKAALYKIAMRFYMLIKSLKSVAFVSSATPMTVSSLSEASRQRIE